MPFLDKFKLFIHNILTMKEFIGSHFHRWTVLSLDRVDPSRKAFYSCLCKCGTVAIVRKDQLTRGISKSCGCWKREVASEQITRLSTTHGLANKTRTYGIWKGIHGRCANKNLPSYSNYGGRGIKVCKRWDDYVLFLKDMGEAPKGMSIDRYPDNNGDYEPSNCRWADAKMQMNNMRSNILFKHKGEILTLKQLAEKIGMPYSRLYQRLFKLSWSLSKAII